MRTRTIIVAVFGMAVSTQSNATEATKQACLSALTDLELPSEPYEFVDGWLGDKHMFGETVECSERRGRLFITQRGKTVAEDGFFGPAALSARDEALTIQDKKNEVLEEERDRAIASARDSYRASRDVLENETQQQLQQIRDGAMPESLVEAIETERLKREATEKAAAELKAEQAAERAIKEQAAREAERTEEANCRQNLGCWGDKAFTTASVMCPGRIERFAKNAHEWTDGLFGAKFKSYRWQNEEAGVVTVLGDSLKFQNGFGAMVNMVYECDVDPASNTVVDIRVSEGRL